MKQKVKAPLKYKNSFFLFCNRTRKIVRLKQWVINISSYLESQRFSQATETILTGFCVRRFFSRPPFHFNRRDFQSSSFLCVGRGIFESRLCRTLKLSNPEWRGGGSAGLTPRTGIENLASHTLIKFLNEPFLASFWINFIFWKQVHNWLINWHSYDDRKQERRQKEYNIILWNVPIEKKPDAQPPARIERHFWTKKAKVIPGIEPLLLGKKPIALPLVPSPLPYPHQVRLCRDNSTKLTFDSPSSSFFVTTSIFLYQPFKEWDKGKN